MADARAEANRKTALREAAINATLNHPHIVTTYTYDMQPLGDTQTSGRGFLDWQMYIIQVGLAICILRFLSVFLGFLPSSIILWTAMTDPKLLKRLVPLVCTAQEYCDGGTLLSAISAKSFFDRVTQAPRLALVLPLLSQIASGCAYIHAKNIIHGDLKPDNVLLKMDPAKGLQDREGGAASPSPDSTLRMVAKVTERTPLCWRTSLDW